MRSRTCPHCRQPIAIERAGVRLPPLKAAIFDAIKAAGAIGVSTDELIARLYENRVVSRETIKAHVNQINDRLAETDYQIISMRGLPALWVLIKTTGRKLSEHQDSSGGRMRPADGRGRTSFARGQY